LIYYDFCAKLQKSIVSAKEKGELFFFYQRKAVPLHQKTIVLYIIRNILKMNKVNRVNFIEVKEIKKSYGKREILKGVSFYVKKVWRSA